MARKVDRRAKSPTLLARVKFLEHAVHHQHKHLERLAMTAADLQTAVDALTAAVTKVQTEVTTLKNTPALITQEQLDANTAAVTAATATLSAL